MDDKQIPSFDFDEEEVPPISRIQNGQLSTETIDLAGLVEEDVTSSGAYDFRGLQATWFGKLLQALPIPSFLVDRSREIIFANTACEKIHVSYKKMEGRPFAALFPNKVVSTKSDALAERVFLTRKSEMHEALIAIGPGKIFGRMHFIALRMAGDRALLVLVEDLTTEKKQLLLTQRHQAQLKKEIDERQQVEKTLLESEKRYRQLVENARDNIFLADVEGRITHINPVGLRLLGYSEKEIVGKRHTDLIHPRFKERTEILYQNQLKFKSPDSYHEYPAIRKDRKIVWFGQQTQLVTEGQRILGFQAIARDITERRLAENALRRNEIKFRSLAEYAPFGLSVAAADKLEYVNPKFTEILGYTLEDVPDLSALLEKLCSNESLQQDLSAKWRSDEGNDLNATVLPVRCKEGKQKILSIRAVLQEDGKRIFTFQDITAETIAQNQLRQSKREWERTFDAVPDLIMILDKHHRILRLNEAMADKMKGSYQELIGRRCFELVHETSAPPPNCPHARLVSDGKDHSAELASCDSTGIFEVSVSPLYNSKGELQGSVHVARDITVRKQMEEALSQSEKRYRQLFEISPYPMLVHRDGKILLANEAAAGVYGVTYREDLVGRSVTDLVCPDCRQSMGEQLNHVEETGTQAPFAEIRVARPDGQEAYLETTAVATRYEGMPAVLSVGQDVTARKRAEESLLRSERLKALGELASGVAHNFNNLLQVVTAGAQLASLELKAGKLDEAKEKLEQILNSAHLGAETVQRLQEFAQVRRENVVVGRDEIVDLAEVVQRAIDMSEPWWKTRPEKDGIIISLHAELGQGCFVKGQQGEFFEVVLNLVKNAAEALPRGGEIRIATWTEQDKVVLQVQDNGIGIPTDNFGRIFEPFWTSKGFQATGMGLASSLGIIKRSGGDISVKSYEGGGSTFKVTLPLAPRIATENEISRSPDFDGQLTILAIDDTEPVVSLLKDGLIAYGQTAVTALSGEEGLEIFKNNRIDLIICDLAMPGMTGWQVGKSVKEMCRERGVPKTPFILLTGWGGQCEEQSKITEAGVDGIVEKPIDFLNLLKAVEEVVSRPGRQDFPPPDSEKPAPTDRS